MEKIKIPYGEADFKKVIEENNEYKTHSALNTVY